MAFKSKIRVIIISAQQTYFDGEAYAISSENDLGPFDILQGHSVFISLIHNKITVYKTPSSSVEFPVTTGVLTVKDDQVRIYVGF